MLGSIFTVDEAHRATIPDLLAHPWMQHHAAAPQHVANTPNKRPIPLPRCIIQSFIEAAASRTGVEWMAVDVLLEVQVHLNVHSAHVNVQVLVL